MRNAVFVFFAVLLSTAGCATGASGNQGGASGAFIPVAGAGGASGPIVDAGGTVPTPGIGDAGLGGQAGGQAAGNGGAGGAKVDAGGSGQGGGAGNTAGKGDAGAPGNGGAGGAVEPLPNNGLNPTMLPTAKGDCPTIATGTVQISGVNVALTVGQKSATQKGPIFIYWHGTGMSSSFLGFDLDPTLQSEITGLGGVIAAPDGSTGTGNAVDWGVWTTGDLEIADQVVACSIQQLNIDTQRIYTGGTSAGGLMAGAMAFARSGYVAAANPNSGGIAWPGQDIPQDPSHIPAVMTMHGARGQDMVVVEFTDTSLSLDRSIAAKGGFAVDCDHGGGHGMAPAELKAAGWQFMKAHPFGVSPEPYAGGLPSNFPSYCTIVK